LAAPALLWKEANPGCSKENAMKRVSVMPKPIFILAATLALAFSFSLFAGSGAILAPLVYAAEVGNGVMETETGRAPSGTSIQGPIPIGGPWIEFAFGETGSFATGCSPADPAGPGCQPSSGGNSVFGDAPPWTFTAPPGGATLTVTDAFLRGDIFEIFDFGASIGTTSIVDPNGDCGDNPDPCLIDPLVSHGVFPLEPGPHEITIEAIASPFGGGAAYFRVDAAEAKLDHFLCYKVKPQEKFKQKEVLIRNQFGEQTFIILEPDTLCVPSTKHELGQK
jgi:hypothetical protein